jgi:hypothetical protein
LSSTNYFPHQERNKSEKFLFLVSFYLFFVYGQKIMCHRYMFFMWKKSKKNVASYYCKLVTFSFKFVAVCHYILQVVRHLLQVACHYEFTRNCKFLHVLHVVHLFHILIIIPLALIVFSSVSNGSNPHFNCELSPTTISVFPLSVVDISFCCG